jgi:tetratricopeptide (TPR) repeat protein
MVTTTLILAGASSFLGGYVPGKLLDAAGRRIRERLNDRLRDPSSVLDNHDLERLAAQAVHLVIRHRALEQDRRRDRRCMKRLGAAVEKQWASLTGSSPQTPTGLSGAPEGRGDSRQQDNRFGALSGRRLAALIGGLPADVPDVASEGEASGHSSAEATPAGDASSTDGGPVAPRRSDWEALLRRASERDWESLPRPARSDLTAALQTLLPYAVRELLKHDAAGGDGLAFAGFHLLFMDEVRSSLAEIRSALRRDPRGRADVEGFCRRMGRRLASEDELAGRLGVALEELQALPDLLVGLQQQIERQTGAAERTEAALHEGFAETTGRLDALRRLLASDGGAPRRPAASTNFPAAGVTRNRRFVGREAPLRHIRKRLAPPRAGGLALVAGGGFGKTQLAVEYAFRDRKSYDGVWFVDASAPSALRRHAQGIAEALGQPVPSDAPLEEVVGAASQALSGGRHLLILDDLPDASTLRLFSVSLPGRILATTRRSDLPADRIATYRLGPLDAGDAVQLLREAASSDGRGGRAPGSSATAEGRGALLNLANRLYRHPLALALAGAHLRRHPRLGPSGLADRFGQAPIGSGENVLDDLDPEHAAAGYRHSVEASLLLHVPTLGAATTAEDRWRQAVLAALSLLAPSPIPVTFVTDLFALPYGFESLRRSQKTIQAERSRTEAFLQQLADVSVIERAPDETLRVHGLVQEAIRSRLPVQLQVHHVLHPYRSPAAHAYVRLGDHLARTWDRFLNVMPDPGLRAIEVLLPHTEAFLERVPARRWTRGQLASLHEHVAVLHEVHVRFEAAETARRQAVEVDREQSYKNPLMERSRELARYLRRRGRPEDALSVLENIEALFEEQGRLGTVAGAGLRMEIGEALLEAGQVEPGIEHLQAARKAAQRLVADHRPSWLDRLAAWWVKRKKPRPGDRSASGASDGEGDDGAARPGNEAGEDRRSVTAPEPVRALIEIEVALSRALLHAGRAVPSIEAISAAVARIDEWYHVPGMLAAHEKLAPTQYFALTSSTRTALRVVAAAYAQVGRCLLARSGEHGDTKRDPTAAGRVVPDPTDFSQADPGQADPGRTGPVRAGTGEAGQHEALKAYREALSVLERIGQRREEMQLLTEVGDACVEAGRPGEAAEAYHEALSRSASLFGPVHPRHLARQLASGDALLGLGRSEEAERLYRDAIDAAGELCGANHPDRSRGLLGLGRALRARGQKEASREAFERALATGLGWLVDGGAAGAASGGAGSAVDRLAPARQVSVDAAQALEALGGSPTNVAIDRGPQALSVLHDLAGEGLNR